MSEKFYEVNVEPGYAADCKVTPPDGYEEVSRIFDTSGNLVKVFFKIKEPVQ